MAQNTSHAVMAQRSEAADSLDFFPTPPWATRALCEWLSRKGHRLDCMTCWEPACGEGHMARPLEESFQWVLASDCHRYGYGEVCDFLDQSDWGEVDWDWIITNPPFALAEAFIDRALMRAERGAAMLVRTSFLEGEKRHRRLYSATPPSAVIQFSERVIMTKGICRDPAIPYWDEKTQQMRRPSSATAYSWLVWIKGHEGPTILDWIPPCRRALEKAGDYPLPLPSHGRVEG